MIPEATGRPGYHPGVLLKIYVYGYINQVQSSRRLEREAQAGGVGNVARSFDGCCRRHCGGAAGAVRAASDCLNAFVHTSGAAPR